MATTVHYVTHVKIERVEVTPCGDLPARLHPSEDRRIVAEVGSVTVKAATLADLARKITGHIDLFDDAPTSRA